MRSHFVGSPLPPKCERNKHRKILNENRNKRVYSFTQTVYIQLLVRQVFIDLRDEKSDTGDLKVLQNL